ncbi:hypothetical protein IWZ00DRAFT_360807 [Phyllosticta capitalensis]
MVVSMLLALSICPGMLGTQEAIRQGQQKERREEHRARRCHLVVGCLSLSRRGRAIDGRQIVLKDSRLWIETGSPTTEGHHPFTGYYLPFPDAKYEGVVSTITQVAPILNWIYIDKNTYQVKYGVRIDAEPNLTGPFDCTRQDRRLTFDGWEGFVAVEEEPDLWALYFDRDDNGLQGRIPPHMRALEITLSRKEMKISTEELRRQQELQSNVKIVNRANQQNDGPAPPEDPKAQQEQVEENTKVPQTTAGASAGEHVPSSPTEQWGSTSIWSQQTESRAEPAPPFTPASSVYADDRVSEAEGKPQETPKAGKTYKSPYIEDAEEVKVEDATSGLSIPAMDLEKKVEHEHVTPPAPVDEGVEQSKSAPEISEDLPTNIDKAPAPSTSEHPQDTTPEKVDQYQSARSEPVDDSPAQIPAENQSLAETLKPAEENASRDVPVSSVEAPFEKATSLVEPSTSTLKTTELDSSSVSDKPLSPSPPPAPTAVDPAAAPSGTDQGQPDAATDDMLAYLRLLRLQDTPNPSPWTEAEGPHRPLPSPYAPLQQQQTQHRALPDYGADYDEWSQTAPTHLLSPSPTLSPTGSKAPTTRSVSLASTAPHSNAASATASRSSSLTISGPRQQTAEQEEPEANSSSSTTAAAPTTSSIPPAVGNARPLPALQSQAPPPPSPPQTQPTLPPSPPPLSLLGPSTNSESLSHTLSSTSDHPQSKTDGATLQRNDTKASTGVGRAGGAPARAAAVPPQWDGEAEGEGEEEVGADGKQPRWRAIRTRFKSLRKKSSRKMG